MVSQEDIDLLKQGVARWNAWRGQHPEIRPDLSGANLSGANLSEALLVGAELIDADLTEANLMDANLSNASLIISSLSNANLTGADLSHANLCDADLDGADLSGADLSGADLSNANLDGANLSHANLRGAIMWATILAHTNLHEVVGLTEIDHQGPSRVELYTIQLPQDDSALHFLHGAGVPDEYIALWRTIAMHPVQYHS